MSFLLIFAHAGDHDGAQLRGGCYQRHLTKNMLKRKKKHELIV